MQLMPATLTPMCRRGDHLGHGRHADGVGAQRAQHADLRGRLIRRPDRQQYTPSRKPTPVAAALFLSSSSSPGSYAWLMSGKRVPSASSFGPISGFVAGEVQVVGDRHQVPDLEPEVDAARGVGGRPAP